MNSWSKHSLKVNSEFLINSIFMCFSLWERKKVPTVEYTYAGGEHADSTKNQLICKSERVLLWSDHGNHFLIRLWQNAYYIYAPVIYWCRFSLLWFSFFPFVNTITSRLHLTFFLFQFLINLSCIFLCCLHSQCSLWLYLFVSLLHCFLSPSSTFPSLAFRIEWNSCIEWYTEENLSLLKAFTECSLRLTLNSWSCFLL